MHGGNGSLDEVCEATNRRYNRTSVRGDHNIAKTDGAGNNHKLDRGVREAGHGGSYTDQLYTGGTGSTTEHALTGDGDLSAPLAEVGLHTVNDPFLEVRPCICFGDHTTLGTVNSHRSSRGSIRPVNLNLDLGVALGRDGRRQGSQHHGYDGIAGTAETLAGNDYHRADLSLCGGNRLNLTGLDVLPGVAACDHRAGTRNQHHVTSLGARARRGNDHHHRVGVRDDRTNRLGRQCHHSEIRGS